MSSLPLSDVKIKYVHNSILMVTKCPAAATLQALDQQVRELCKFGPEHSFTLKWLDDEQDPCVISSDIELSEALRLYEVNKEAQITILVFDGIPPGPGEPCPNEDVNMYRRGAKRWTKKFYLLYGHQFAVRRFNPNATCTYCKGKMWGLGQQGFKCINCNLLLHRRCQGGIRHKCGEPFVHPSYSDLRSISFPSGASEYFDNRYTDRDEDYNSAGTTTNVTTIITTTSTSVTTTTTGHSVPVVTGRYTPGRVTGGAAQTEKTLTIPISKPSTIQVVRENETVNEYTNAGYTSDFSQPSSPSLVDRGTILTGNTDKVIPVVNEIPDIPVVDSGVSWKDFNLLKVIGRGSYAKVFQVEHKPTKRIYAMKVIKKETILDEEDIEWVQTEKHVFECASNHPFLVGLHSCFQTKSRLFFVIEFVNGGDLMFYMQRNLRLAEDYARFYAAEICIALNFLHERGIIYRDLKLDNVLMDSEGHIKLTDYGMCKEGITGDLTTSTFCGTPNYIAPEILNGDSYSFSVDWWALGVLMFEMLAGRSPWEGVGQSANPDQNTEDYLFQVILTKPIRFPRSISVRATNILVGFLKKSPAKRLGCPPDSNFADIMNHAFFAPIDWIALEQKQIPPPYRPTYSDDRDLVHFDPTFTNEPVVLTPDNEEFIARIDQTEFEGFDYVNPLLMTLNEEV